MRVLNRSLLLCPLVILDGYCLCVWCPVARSSWQSIWCLLEVLLEGLNRTALLVKCVEEVFGLVSYRRPSRESPRKSSSSVLRRPYTVEDPPGKKEEMHNFIELWSIGSAMYAKHQVSKDCYIVPLRNYLWCSASYLRTVFIKNILFFRSNQNHSIGRIDRFVLRTDTMQNGRGENMSKRYSLWNINSSTKNKLKIFMNVAVLNRPLFEYSSSFRDQPGLITCPCDLLSFSAIVVENSWGARRQHLSRSCRREFQRDCSFFMKSWRDESLLVIGGNFVRVSIIEALYRVMTSITFLMSAPQLSTFRCMLFWPILLKLILHGKWGAFLFEQKKNMNKFIFADT